MLSQKSVVLVQSVFPILFVYFFYCMLFWINGELHAIKVHTCIRRIQECSMALLKVVNRDKGNKFHEEIASGNENRFKKIKRYGSTS